MKIQKLTIYIIIAIQCIATSGDDNINCNGTILLNHLNLSKNDQREKKLDVFCGDELKLQCQLDETSLNNGCKVSNLSYAFGVNGIPPDNTSYEEVDNKTLQLNLNTENPLEITVTCKYNHNGLNKIVLAVNVGLSPQPIEMQCVNYIGKILECEFKMSGNPVKEEYDIMFYYYSMDTIQFYKLADFQRIDKKRKWSIKSTNFKPFGAFIFTVNGTNRFGELRQNFTFHNNQIAMIPKLNPPVVTEIKCRNAVVEVNLPRNISMYEFSFKVTTCLVQCYKLSSFLVLDITDIIYTNKTEFLSVSLSVTLPHSNQFYKFIQVLVQLKDGLYPERQQLTLKTKGFKSLPCRPDRPPHTSFNAFEIREHNEATIYWQEIANFQKNGNNFAYQVAEILENGKTTENVTWKILTNSTARIKYLDRRKHYEVRLLSQNAMGTSAKSDAIRIPRTEHVIQPPSEMSMELNQNIYNISWKSPTEIQVNSYTIFWCKPADEQKTMCDTLLGTSTLPKNQTMFLYNNTQESDMKIFALAVNTHNSSSGLYWITCPKITPYVTNSSFSTITINWTMPCHSPMTKMQLSYCLVESSTGSKCKEPKKKISVPVNLKSVILTELNRCSHYKIEIYNFFKNTTMPIIKAKTTEGDLPKPIGLVSKNVTSTSIEIAWSLPYECKEADHYSITYYEKLMNGTDKMNRIIHYPNGSKLVRLENLNSFSLYNIKLAFCNREQQCSESSETINETTKFGVPHKIGEFISNINDNNFTIYSWQPPSIKNAPISVYEIQHIFTRNGLEMKETSIVASPKCTLTKNNCNNGISKYKYLVRVINMDKVFSGDHIVQMNEPFRPNVCFQEIQYNITSLCETHGSCLLGEWHIKLESECSTDKIYVVKFLVIIIIVIAIGCGLVIGILVGVRKYQSIKNVGKCSMPEGLDNIFKSKSQIMGDETKCCSSSQQSPPHDSQPKDEYINYQYLFSSTNHLDRINASRVSLKYEDEAVEYDSSANVTPLPMRGDYVKLHELQNHQPIMTSTSSYTPISALQQPEYNVPKSNGYIPVSAISTFGTTSAAATHKINKYISIQMLNEMKPLATTMPLSNGEYTPVSALQNSCKLKTFSTNGYISIAALQSQTS